VPAATLNLTSATTTAEGGVSEVGVKKEKITIRIQAVSIHARSRHASKHCAQRHIEEIDDDDSNIVIPNSLAGDRNNAAPEYVGQTPNYPARATRSGLVRNAGGGGAMLALGVFEHVEPAWAPSPE
jgi:hypothetical protein